MPQRIYSRPKAIVESLFREDVNAARVALDRLDTLSTKEWVELITAVSSAYATPYYVIPAGLFSLIMLSILTFPLLLWLNATTCAWIFVLCSPIAIAIPYIVRRRRKQPTLPSTKAIQQTKEAVSRRIGQLSSPALAQAAPLILSQHAEESRSENGSRFSAQIIKAMEQATLRLLPTITRSQAAEWSHTSREAVYSLIQPRMSDWAFLKDLIQPSVRDWELAACALDAAERWSDPRAMPRITTLLRYGGIPADVRAQAQRVCAALETQYDNFKQGKTLLRPSQAVTTDNLLRPAASIPDRTDELLRPTQSTSLP